MSRSLQPPPDARYAKDESVVSRLVGDEFILVPTRANVAELDSIYVLNAVAGRIWELIDGQHSIRDICDMIEDEFEVSREKVERDVVEFMQKLASIQTIKLVAETAI